MATPIGNLGDITKRAISTLGSADLICAEDTRRTRELLSHLGIRGHGRLLSLHGHNERSRIEEVLYRIERGKTVALVSDSGTPSLSDPGAALVVAVASRGFKVSAVPGPSAAVMALVISGLPVERFCFEGFLPRRGGERRKRIEALSLDERTTVVYESPLRLGDTLADLAAICGVDRPVVIARELTKMHEEVWRGSLGDAGRVFAERPVRGEIVLVLGGAVPDHRRHVPDEELTRAVARCLDDGESAKDAATEVAAELGVSRRRAYEIAVAVRGGRTGSDLAGESAQGSRRPRSPRSTGGTPT